jgi:ABC-type bacteriocin/lantibiotic exporter with double-glycine peptidase domain
MHSVGSGKSTLLKAILGEIEHISGTRQMRRGIKVAFCDQEPWLLDQSVKENIVGSRLFDPEWYDRVIDACALAQDIDGFAEGDNTSVGSGGSALSGGQKSRVVSPFRGHGVYSSVLTTAGPCPRRLQQT